MPLQVKMKSVLLSAVTLITVFGSSLATYAAPNLASHRAVYDVKLKDASDRSGITGMTGRIVYEFRGSACDGYTTSFRFVTRLSARGETNLTDQRTSTFEDGDGESFRFVTKTYVNDKQDRHIEGSAQFTDAETTVQLKKPETVELNLPKARFPTNHVLDMINRAEAGETFYEEQIFDGSDGGDRVLTTTVIIGPEKTESIGEQELLGDLEKNPFRSINVAYFDEVNDPEGLPEYSIAFKMHDNGVTRALVMDYGDFVLSGKLTDLEMFESDPCN